MHEGDVYHTKFNGDIQIIRYGSKKDIDVKFLQTGYIKTTDATNIKRGTLKDPLYPRVYNRGFLGVGKHEASINRKPTYKYRKTRSHTDGFQRNNAKCLDEKGISRFVPHSSF